MVKRNIAIALIIIILFVLLAIVGFFIYAIQSGMPFTRGGRDDEEDGL
jgi:hypothetical protein